MRKVFYLKFVLLDVHTFIIGTRHSVIVVNEILNSKKFQTIEMVYLIYAVPQNTYLATGCSTYVSSANSYCQTYTGLTCQTNQCL